MKITKSIILAFILIGVIAISSCSEDEECPDEQVPNLVLTFSQSDNQTIDTVFVYSHGLADSLYIGNSNPDTLYIPLKLAMDTTPLSLEIKYSDSITNLIDHMQLIHSHKIYSKNLECGFATEFYLHSIVSTVNIVDSIFILDSVINTDNVIHAKIYY